MFTLFSLIVCTQRDKEQAGEKKKNLTHQKACWNYRCANRKRTTHSALPVFDR